MLALDGSAGDVTNAGTSAQASTVFGPNTSFGALASLSDVVLRPGVTGASVSSSGVVRRGPGSQVGSVSEHVTSMPLSAPRNGVGSGLRRISGTLLAPNSALELGPQQEYEATVFAKSVRIGPGVTIKRVETPFLIGELKITKTTACVGDDIEAALSAGTQSTAPAEITTRIMGVVGTRQHVQFGGIPGDRTVFATAVAADGRADFASVPVTVVSCTAPAMPPVALHFWGSRKKPDIVDLSVSTYDADGREIPLSDPATYEWTFGDGTSATTTVPVVEHDYSRSVQHLAPFS